MEMQTRHIDDFYIAGFTYWEGLKYVQHFKIGDVLELRQEPDNRYDPEAVAICFKGEKIGYIPALRNTQIFQMLYFGHNVFEAIISQLNLETHPERQVRVTVRLKDGNK